MIDIHTHVVPGIDDGPQSFEESIEIVKRAVRDGIKVMVATPHILETPSESICKKISNAILGLKQRIISKGIDIQIISGAELFISPELPHKIKDHTQLTINNGNKYALIELPVQEIPVFTQQTIFELLVSGIRPIISHPERYIEIQRNPGKLFDLVQKGVLTQVNAGSLMGRYGKKAQKTAKTLLSYNLIHTIGSDVHSTSNGSYPLSQGVDMVAKVVGIQRAKAMVTSIPYKIINGEKIDLLSH